MSCPSVKPDIGSKVLPGDKTGLPFEIWRMIFAYLYEDDLCRASCVCKTWNELVLSLDSTRWQELYLLCHDWKHPYWPLNIDAEPPSWKQAFKEQSISSKFWARNQREPDPTTCLYVLKRKKERKNIHVGPGQDHETLKSALSVAHDYDRIIVHPGIYDEQFEMSSKIPFEIVGDGELGSVILVVCIEQIALTGRVSNLVFRAPWFTNFILKVRAGYLQVDNCILEDGMVYIQNPGTCLLKFCTFRHATVILQYTNTSVIENCEFSQTDSAAITVEGYPRDDRNWTYGYLMEKMVKGSLLPQTQRNPKGFEAVPTSAFSTSTAFTSNQKTEKSYDFKTDITSCNEQTFGMQSLSSSAKFSQVHSEVSERPLSAGNLFKYLKTMSDAEKLNGITIPDHSTQQSFKDESLNFASSENGEVKLAETNMNSDLSNLEESEPSKLERSNFGSNCSSTESAHAQISPSKESNVNNITPRSSEFSQPGSSGEQKKNVDSQMEAESQNHSKDGASPPENLALRLNSRSSDGTQRSDSLSMISGSDLFDNDDDSIGEFESGSNNGGSSSSSDDEGNDILSDGESDYSSSEESVIMLSYPEHQQPRSVSAASMESDVQSICSQNQSEHIRIVQDDNMRKVLDEVRGCLIKHCRISQCKGGVMVSLQAHAIITRCDINSVGYGIRCIQNARVVLLKNEIHHCRTSGVFMRLAASGLIAGNDIHSNCEAGIDIRKNADPIVQSNRIHHGKRSGVVVLGSGRGQIKNNEIFQNKEAGVYILYRGNPVVRNNQIYSGKAAGIAVNEGGRGYVVDNVITSNQWGGVDIRHGGDPVITQNHICNGLSDGIVIGEMGRGSLENNFISGNSGCGIWITAACQPMIHGNQINSNGDAGITFVNKMDAVHSSEAHGGDKSEILNQRRTDFWAFANDEQPHPRRSCERATVEYNNIYHNNGRGIKVQYSDEVDIQCNAVRGNRGDGIYLDQVCPVFIKDNSITCNSGNGIITTNAGKVLVQGNGIFDNRDHGISCQNEADLQANDIIGNQRCGIYLCKNPEVTVSQNRLKAPNDKAVSAAGVMNGSIHDNEIFKTSHKSVEMSSDCKCTVKDNKLVTIESQHAKSSQASVSSQDKFDKEYSILTNPSVRPHIEAPTTIPTLPANQISTVTRVTVPSASSCEEGSKLCNIL